MFSLNLPLVFVVFVVLKIWFLCSFVVLVFGIIIVNFLRHDRKV